MAFCGGEESFGDEEEQMIVKKQRRKKKGSSGYKDDLEATATPDVSDFEIRYPLTAAQGFCQVIDIFEQLPKEDQVRIVNALTALFDI